jgi:hypothetical protein
VLFRNELAIFYRIFGLTVQTSRSLPGVVPAEPPSYPTDLVIEIGGASAPDFDSCRDDQELFYTSAIQTDTGESALRIWKRRGGAFFQLDYYDGTQFWVDAQGGRIWAQWSDRSSFEDTVTYLLGPVLGFVLRIRSVTSLHASAVVCEGKALAFVGMPGAGKSTTAAAMAQRRHAVLSDDIVALSECERRYYAAPAYPYLSLWPEAADALYGRGKTLPAFSENYDKRRISLDAEAFANEPVALRAIFVLQERIVASEAPYIETMTPREALISLVTNTYANLLLNEEMRVREFELLGRLVGAVPVLRVHAHQDAKRIGALCELIEDEFMEGRTRAVPAASGR